MKDISTDCSLSVRYSVKSYRNDRHIINNNQVNKKHFGCFRCNSKTSDVDRLKMPLGYCQSCCIHKKKPASFTKKSRLLIQKSTNKT